MPTAIIVPNLRAPHRKQQGVQKCDELGHPEWHAGVVVKVTHYAEAAGRMWDHLSLQHFGHPNTGANHAPSHELCAWLDAPTPHEVGAQLRQKIAVEARWAISHAPDIHYTEGGLRMGWVRAHALKLPAYEDCSSSITGLYCVAGAPDPNGLGYDGQGYTGTMMQHCRRLAGAGAAMLCDLVIWLDAQGDSHHVAMVIDQVGNDDPILYSHGSEGGPYRIAFSAEHAIQSSLGHHTAAWLTVPNMPDRQ